MPYILNKTNGSEIAIINDATSDLTTDLTFLGKNYAGYGEIYNENFLKLLENFSNSYAPSKPIEGQLWFDSTNKKLFVYDNVSWKSIANLEISSSSAPPTTTKELTKGDLWYNTDTDQLNIYNGTEFVIIGPAVGSDIKSQWRGDFESSLPGVRNYNIKAVIGTGNDVIAVVSADSYELTDYNASDSPEYPIRSDNFTKIERGITLVGADPITGSTRKEVTGLEHDSYFWGTAAESLHSLTATTAEFSSGASFKSTTTNKLYNVPFVDTSSGPGSEFFIEDGLKYNPNLGILYTKASSAFYADIAERYHADAYYEPGTVLVIGGVNEVTLCHEHGSTALAGVVSKNPAYRLNDEAGPNETHPLIALKGRVMCKVIGPVSKGDILVTSSYPGYAEKSAGNEKPCSFIGKALQDFNGVKGFIEIKV